MVFVLEISRFYINGGVTDVITLVCAMFHLLKTSDNTIFATATHITQVLVKHNKKAHHLTEIGKDVS